MDWHTSKRLATSFQYPLINLGRDPWLRRTYSTLTMHLRASRFSQDLLAPVIKLSAKNRVLQQRRYGGEIPGSIF